MSFFFIVFIFYTCSLGYALSSQLGPTPCLPPPSLDTHLHNHNIRCAAGRVLARAMGHHTLTARPPPFARTPNQQFGTLCLTSLTDRGMTLISPHLPIFPPNLPSLLPPCYHLLWCHSRPSLPPPLLTRHLQRDSVLESYLATRQYMVSLLDLTRHDTIAIVNLIIRLASTHIFMIFWYVSPCTPMFSSMARKTHSGAWRPR
jgi:hypothetical protein